ncbi:MAG: hypothetical protein AAB484_02610 [Patescibacteria group bacterium]
MKTKRLSSETKGCEGHTLEESYLVELDSGQRLEIRHLDWSAENESGKEAEIISDNSSLEFDCDPLPEVVRELIIAFEKQGRKKVSR